MPLATRTTLTSLNLDGEATFQYLDISDLLLHFA